MQETRFEIKISCTLEDFFNKSNEVILLLKELQTKNTLKENRIEVQITESSKYQNVSVKKVAEQLSRRQKSRY